MVMKLKSSKTNDKSHRGIVDQHNVVLKQKKVPLLSENFSFYLVFYIFATRGVRELKTELYV